MKGVLGVILLLMLVSCTEIPIQEVNITARDMYVAGQFYPGSDTRIKASYNEYIGKAEDLDLNVKALILPHAGWIYSGEVCAAGVKQLNQDSDRIILIGNNHNAESRFYGVSVPTEWTHYETPLGRIPIDYEAVMKLSENNLVTSNKGAHTTHIIEVILPFLQEKLEDFSIIPIVIGGLNDADRESFVQVLEEFIDDKTLIVVSSDLSHYHEYDEANKLDTECINKIEQQDVEGIKTCEACGIDGIKIISEISLRKGWDAKIIDYKNSGDTAGTKSRVVGYGAIAFFDESREKFLLELARASLEQAVLGKKPVLNEDLLNSELTEKKGCFVTLGKDDGLRGCIGYIEPKEPLYQCIIDNAGNAALHDRRFNPVTEDELDDISVEVSVLTVPQELEFSDHNELFEKIQPGVDGVIIRKGFKQSTYLPTVWDQLTTKESFFSNLCKKAGLIMDCYKEDITVLTYQADVFHE